MQSKKRALGKGLSALLPPRNQARPESATLAPGGPTATSATATATDERLQMLPVDAMSPNPYQPRQNFDEAALQELVTSIRDHGIIQPIAVSRRGESYTIVGGERRWRGARVAGLQSVPAIVLKLTDEEMLEFSLVENLQRENLNPIEEARGYRALMQTFGLTQDEVADRVGKGRTTVANTLRLLNLPLEYQKDIEAGRISPGHARAILSLEHAPQRSRLRDTIVRDELSVREAEQLAVEIANRRTRSKGTARALDPNTQKLREMLIERLTCRVNIKTFDQNRGRIEILYSSLDELERILQALDIEL